MRKISKKKNKCGEDLQKRIQCQFCTAFYIKKGQQNIDVRRIKVITIHFYLWDHHLPVKLILYWKRLNNLSK